MLFLMHLHWKLTYLPWNLFAPHALFLHLTLNYIGQKAVATLLSRVRAFLVSDICSCTPLSDVIARFAFDIQGPALTSLTRVWPLA